MKKIFVVAILVSALAACGSKKNSTTNATTNNMGSGSGDMNTGSGDMGSGSGSGSM